jgi:hypothetical protein
MKLTIVVAAAVVIAALAAASSASSSTAPSATVENIATVVTANVTDFEFNLYDCPAGDEIVLVDWLAEQPARPGNQAEGGGQPYGLSTGEQVQHLSLSAASDFIAGERWTGSGTVACGAVLIPVSGSGTTKSLNGV